MENSVATFSIFKSEIYPKVKFPKSQISEITGQVQLGKWKRKNDEPSLT